MASSFPYSIMLSTVVAVFVVAAAGLGVEPVGLAAVEPVAEPVVGPVAVEPVEPAA